MKQKYPDIGRKGGDGKGYNPDGLQHIYNAYKTDISAGLIIKIFVFVHVLFYVYTKSGIEPVTVKKL